MLSKIRIAAIGACSGALVAAWGWAEESPKATRGAKEVAERTVSSLKEGLLASTSARPVRVAVLPIIGGDGRVLPPRSAEAALALQGELIGAIRRLGRPGDFSVIGLEGLRQSLLDAGADPATLNAADPSQVRACLEKVSAHVALVGQSGLQGGEEVSFRVIPQVAAAEPKALQVPAPRPVDPRLTYAKRSGRFGVRLLIGGKPVVLVPVDAPDRPQGFSNVVAAKLDPKLVGFVDGKVSNAVPFEIEFSNAGTPLVGWAHDDDRDRIYGVALTVDGVNTLLMPEGGSQPLFVGKEARHAKKWMLTGPGKRLVPAAGRLSDHPECAGCEKCRGYDFGPVQGAGGSLRLVKGFQDGLRMARQFTLAAPNCSVARRAGGGEKAIGLITVHFYPQKLEGDERLVRIEGPGNLGSVPGERVPQHIFPVKVGLYDEPVESWLIYYYIDEGQDKAPLAEDLIPVG